MSTGILERKKKIRAAVKALQWRVPSAMAGAAEALLAQLNTLAAWQMARCPSVYVSTNVEAPTNAVLANCFVRGLSVFVPRISGHDIALHPVRHLSELVPGAFGILEPLPNSPSGALEDVDCVIVPGVAFDANGHRVGRGGGYYDCLLARLPQVPRIALAWQWQIFPEVPYGAGDERVDWIVTPEGVCSCEPRLGGDAFLRFPRHG
ncbi:MAG: 5-formyltetrahydrofolate cyclo-ligase [Puniceicoccales bacterium]|jgi:5-formyltetrahydrofolate cyclo-ligase|nr:5-formyltetrahydrofolate cyclo-ligase [Puniceicoccales bacterium]